MHVEGVNVDRPLHIAVDMDCTIAHTMQHIDAALDARGAEAASLPRYRDGGFTAWDLDAGLNRSQRRILDEMWASDGFFAGIAPIEGARRVLYELEALGHHVTIATAPWPASRTCADDKLAWVERFYSPRWRGRTTLVGDKTTLRADVLVDDKPEIGGHYPPVWRHLIYGDYPYNAHVAGPRLRQWTTAADFLDRIKELP